MCASMIFRFIFMYSAGGSGREGRPSSPVDQNGNNIDLTPICLYCNLNSNYKPISELKKINPKQKQSFI